jgi:hypothetical protein
LEWEAREERSEVEANVMQPCWLSWTLTVKYVSLRHVPTDWLPEMLPPVGMLGCWDVGMLGCWDVGMLGFWDGVLVDTSSEPLV